MNHDEKFPIEPLSDEAWRRIEQRLFDPAAGTAPVAARAVVAARPARRVWQLGLAAAALLALGAWFLPGLRPNASRPLAARHVSAGVSALETVLDAASIRLEPGASAWLEAQGEPGSRVVLERGEARFSVPPRHGRAPFVVQAAAVRVEVVGTRFRVMRTGERVQVVDEEGSVRVRCAEQSWLLRPGTSWSSPASRSDSAAPEPASSAPAPAAPQAPDSAAQQTDMPIAAPAAAVQGRRKESSEPDARTRFEQAARLEASAPEQALSRYGSLAKERGPWAEAALYAQARLVLERKDRARAVALLRGYLSKYPRGANVPDVRALLASLGLHGEVEAP